MNEFLTFFCGDGNVSLWGGGDGTSFCSGGSSTSLWGGGDGTSFCGGGSSTFFCGGGGSSIYFCDGGICGSGGGEVIGIFFFFKCAINNISWNKILK